MRNEMPKRIKILRWTRFALSGSLVGIAVSGLLGAHLGWDKEATDATGDVVGGAVAAFAVKAIHLV
jgi:hypothetical protein